jgi:hypothetical protein
MAQLILILLLVTGLKFHFRELQELRAKPPRVWFQKQFANVPLKIRWPVKA